LNKIRAFDSGDLAPRLHVMKGGAVVRNDLTSRGTSAQ